MRVQMLYSDPREYLYQVMRQPLIRAKDTVQSVGSDLVLVTDASGYVAGLASYGC